MFNISISTNAGLLAEWLRQVESFVKAATGPAGRAHMADLLEQSHKEAFDKGGWAHKGGPAWEPTDPFWVEHLAGKGGNKPLVWKGRGRESIRGVVVHDGVEIRANSYLGKFQFGPFSFREKFPIRRTGKGPNDWEKIAGGTILSADGAADPPSMSGNSRTASIHIHEREVFAFFEADAEQWLNDMAQEAGLA